MLWQHQLRASLILANDVWFLPTRYAYWKKKLIGGGAAGRMLKKSFHMKKEKKKYLSSAFLAYTDLLLLF